MPSSDVVIVSTRSTFCATKGSAATVTDARAILIRRVDAAHSRQKTPSRSATTGVRERESQASRKTTPIRHQDNCCFCTTGKRMYAKPSSAMRAPNIFLSSSPQKYSAGLYRALALADEGLPVIRLKPADW